MNAKNGDLSTHPVVIAGAFVAVILLIGFVIYLVLSGMLADQQQALAASVAADVSFTIGILLVYMELSVNQRTQTEVMENLTAIEELSGRPRVQVEGFRGGELSGNKPQSLELRLSNHGQSTAESLTLMTAAGFPDEAPIQGHDEARRPLNRMSRTTEWHHPEEEMLPPAERSVSFVAPDIPISLKHGDTGESTLTQLSKINQEILDEFDFSSLRVKVWIEYSDASGQTYKAACFDKVFNLVDASGEIVTSMDDLLAQRTMVPEEDYPLPRNEEATESNQ